MSRWGKKEETLTVSKEEILTGQPTEKVAEAKKQPDAIAILTERVQILTEDIREIHQEFSEFVALLGNSFGEPMKTKAAAIALRYRK